ncbi:MAG: Hsp33 family molecular chaperone HslO [Deltaproteobacteria bacterium]|nr:Hsp33 family molecular chaperone HslO [Deltaproteobacteria bacterium]
MDDLLLRGLFPEHEVRFSLVQAPGLCSEAMGIHGSDAVSGWLLSEALVSAALLSTSVKDDEKLTLRWMYPGPVGTILADLNERGEVRGYTQRVTLLPEVDTLAEALGGDGRLSVVQHTAGRVIRTGITQAFFRDLPRDLSYFLSMSHQIETALTVGLILPLALPLQARSALGLMIQPLPGASLEVFDQARNRVEGPAFRAWLEDAPRDPLEVLERVELGRAEVLGQGVPAYGCGCSREKIHGLLTSLPPGELGDMVRRGEDTTITCHFCGRRYNLPPGEIQQLLDQMEKGP